MAAIFSSLFIYCTIRFLILTPPTKLSLILFISPLSNQELVLFLNNLDDVLVLHDVC